MGSSTRSFGISLRLKRFLMRPIYLRRKGFDWQIVLEKPKTVRRVPAALDLSGPSDVRKLKGQLSDLLNRHAAARDVLHHLTVLERLLSRQRPPSFDRLPAALLSGAHRQLVALAGTQPPTEIVALQSRLTLALMDRGLINIDSDLDSLRKMNIEEVSVSIFLEADQQWRACRNGLEPAIPNTGEPPY